MLLIRDYIKIRFWYFLIISLSFFTFSFLVLSNVIIPLLEASVIDYQNNTIYLLRPWVNDSLDIELLTYIVYQTFLFLFYLMFTTVIMYDLFITSKYNLLLRLGKRRIYLYFVFISSITIVGTYVLEKVLYNLMITDYFNINYTILYTEYSYDMFVVLVAVQIFNMVFLMFEKINISILVSVPIYVVTLLINNVVSINIVIVISTYLLILLLTIYLRKNDFSGGNYE